MNLKSTVALVLLAAVAGAWFFLGDKLAPKIGLGPTHPEPAPSQSAAALDSLTPAAITRVEVTPASGNPLVVERTDGAAEWKMPGNWPPRVPEVRELVAILGNLRARFHAVSLGEKPDLAQYGLAPEQKPVAVKVTANGQTVSLLFGEPPASAGESGFTRPAYVRVNDAAEVLRLGPDVMPVVSRPADAYRRRQLFTDTERIRVLAPAAPPSPFGPPPGPDGPVTVTLPGDDTESITVRGPGWTLLGHDLSALTAFTLTRVAKTPEPGILSRGAEPVLRPDRLADSWRLSAPHDDNADPAKLRTVLAALAELWVDEFVHSPPAENLLGFATDGRSISVKRRGADPITVRFGGVAKVLEREEIITIPAQQPGMPERKIPRKVPVEYRYARVDGNPQVFTVAAEKLPDVFASGAELADSKVARFDADEVTEVVVAPAGKPELRLTRVHKGDPDASKDEDRNDRWEIAAKPNPVPADEGRVRELLNRLGGLSADDPDRRRYPTKLPEARTTVTVTARENRAKGEAAAPAREYRLLVGPSDFAKKQLPVALAGRGRVTLADDRVGPDSLDSWVGALLFPETAAAFIDRPALAYRGRKLFDSAGASIKSVSVAGGFSLGNEDAGWKLTAPVSSDADPEKSADLARTLAGLQAAEYLTASPTPDELKAYGLEKPTHTATLAFNNGRTYTLEIGAARSGKPEVYARLDRGAVFALPSSAAEPFTTGALGLLPLKVWGTLPDKVTSVQVTRFGDSAKDSFTLAKDGTNWKLTGPFTAPVPFLNAQPMLTAVGTLNAEKYQSLSAANPAEFGFDKPLASLKLVYSEKKPVAMEEKTTTQTVVIGGTTPDGKWYAKLDAPNAPVFVVPEPFVKAAQTAPLDLPEKALLTLDPTRVAKVQIAAGKPEDGFTLAKDDKGKWSAEGVTFGVDAERIAGLTAAAARPVFTKLAAYGDAVKWADFGLEKPETTITVTLGGDKPETHTIALGNPDPTGARFARVDGGPAVGVLPAGSADSLARKKFEYADRSLLSFDPTAVNAIARTKGKEELELAPGAAVGWDVVKPAKQKADAEFVDELAGTLSRLRAERVAAYGKKDAVFKEHGLDTPAATVTLTVGDKAEQKTLRLGKPVDPAKPDGERFAAVDSAAPEVIVGVLPAALANRLLSPPVAFRDRTLARFVDADKVVVERGDRKVTFAKVGAAWKVTEPVMTAAESGELEAFVADLGKLRADTWVAEKGKDLSAFGLDKPEAKWTLSNGDAPVLVLLVGKKTPDGKVHVVTEKGELVGLLDARTTDRVLAEYRQRKAWDVDAAQADGVEVVRGGAKFAFQKFGGQWLDAAKAGDMIDAKAVNDLLGTLAGLRAERYAADKDADAKLFGLDKPEATLTVTTPTGRKTLEVGAGVGGTDGKQRYARVAEKDRTDVFVLSAADTASLLRERAAYLAKK